jgi:pyruvate dehydrogenase E2 component (dihydrolipoamide acetyltransferase)
MPINILMPALSPTMEKGNLAKWLVKEGDAVKAGQVIAEIETDKATMEYETADEGIMGKIVIAGGTEDIAVGTLIAVLLEEGESVADVKPPTSTAKVAPAPVPAVATAVAPPAVAVAMPIPATGNRILASPLAKRLAAQANIDLAGIKGSGPDGRIVKADLDGATTTLRQAQGERTNKNAAHAEPVEARSIPKWQVLPTDTPYSDIKLSGMRKVIARRLTESKQQVPHIYLSVDCLLDNLLAARKDLNAALEKQTIKLSVNDFVIRAVALALQQVPACNVQFAETVMRQFERVDISVAVSIPGGLITPIIRDAANKGLAALSGEMTSLAERAKAGRLQPDDYQGGTFSISNMGMMGIKDFCAVINPPQAGILAIGAGEQRAVVKDGILNIATVMSVTGSFDHRVVDGADGAAFLAAFKRLIENPILMLA